MNNENKELIDRIVEECGAEDISSFDLESFVEHCEDVYKMKTEDFQLFFEENDFEGNSDMKLWYKLTIGK